MEQTSCDNVGKNGKSNSITPNFFPQFEVIKYFFFSFPLNIYFIYSTEIKYKIL